MQRIMQIGGGLLALLAALVLASAPARAAADDIVGFDDLVLDARYAPDKANGDTALNPIVIGGVKFDQAQRSLSLQFGGVTLDAALTVRSYQGRIQAIVITPVVPLSMDVKDLAQFCAGYADSARAKYSGCNTLLDTFNDRAGMLALKDPDEDGLSLIWDGAKVTIVYQTAVMADANKKENAVSEGSTERPTRLH